MPLTYARPAHLRFIVSQVLWLTGGPGCSSELALFVEARGNVILGPGTHIALAAHERRSSGHSASARRSLCSGVPRESASCEREAARASYSSPRKSCHLSRPNLRWNRAALLIIIS